MIQNILKVPSLPFQVLLWIEKHGITNPSEISRQFHFGSSCTANHLRPLKKHGFIECTKKIGRNRFYEVTQTGQKFLMECQEVIDVGMKSLQKEAEEIFELKKKCDALHIENAEIKKSCDVLRIEVVTLRKKLTFAIKLQKQDCSKVLTELSCFCSCHDDDYNKGWCILCFPGHTFN